MVWKDIIQSMFECVGYRFLRTTTPNMFDAILAQRIETSGTFNLIQIGAYDGKLSDPIRLHILRHRDIVRGTLVEPMRDAMSQLQWNLQCCENLRFEQVAIHPVAKEIVLHWPGDRMAFASARESLIRYWCGEQCGIGSVVCPAITPQELYLRSGLKEVDLLQIDAEGMDCEILHAWPFRLCRPSVIHFEHVCTERCVVLETCRWLSGMGYSVGVEPHDVTAWVFGEVYSEKTTGDANGFHFAMGV